MAKRTRHGEQFYVNPRKGDLVKQRAPGGHIMTVIGIGSDPLFGDVVTASYQTPDGKTHDESHPITCLKRVDI